MFGIIGWILVTIVAFVALLITFTALTKSIASTLKLLVAVPLAVLSGAAVIIFVVIGLLAHVVCYVPGIVSFPFALAAWLGSRSKKGYEKAMGPARWWRRVIKKFSSFVAELIDPLVNQLARPWKWLGKLLGRIYRDSLPVYKRLWPGWKD